MGCNCNQTRPMGTTPKQVAENQAAKRAATPPPKPSSGTTQSFQLADGQTFGSKLEMDAARVRSTG